jgi:Tol biopolymer transport system component
MGQPFSLDEKDPRFSPDGTRIAFAKFQDENVDVWVHDLARDVSQRITFDPAIDERPVWSPDGKRLAFSSARSGHYDLYQAGAGGEGHDELLYSSNENMFASDWSADGSFLMYSTEAGSSNQGIWLLPTQGTGKRIPLPLLHSHANESATVFSPDSRWVAYMSDESGSSEVYVQAFSSPPASIEGKPKVLVSRGGGTNPH